MPERPVDVLCATVQHSARSPVVPHLPDSGHCIVEEGITEKDIMMMDEVSILQGAFQTNFTRQNQRQPRRQYTKDLLLPLTILVTVP